MFLNKMCSTSTNFTYWPGLEESPIRYPLFEAKETIYNTTMIEKKPPVEEKIRPYSCEECGKTFLLKHHLTTHARTHLGIRPHACLHCGKTFTHKHCLNTHLLLHSSERPFQCEECKKSFTLKHHLITHKKVHSREKPFICTECGQAFPVKRHLTTHSKFHAGERPFICEKCGESFAQKEHLVMHSRFHGSINSFVCNDCGATFTRKFELVNHGRLHGKEPHCCVICHKEFYQKRTLLAHMKSHQESQNCYSCKTEDKLALSCRDCGCIFTNSNALNLHLKLHRGDPIRDVTLNLNSKICKYTCEFCGKNYSTKHGLVNHNKRHENGICALRSHVCSICNKGFFQKNHLLLHQRQHDNANWKSARQNQEDVTKLFKLEKNPLSS